MIIYLSTGRRQIDSTDLIAHYMPGIGQTTGSTGEWEDQSTWPYNLDMVQNTAARVPSIVSVAGYDVFSFTDSGTNANDDFLLSPETGFDYLSGRAGATLFAVIQFDSAQTVTGGIFGVQNGPPFSTTGFNLVMVSDSGMKPGIYYRRSTGDTTSAMNSTVAMTNGSLYCLIGRINFANGSQALNITVNGTQTNGTAPAGSPYVFSCTNDSPIAGCLGRGVTDPLLPSTVKILECGVYGVYLSDTRRNDLQSVLMSKFGI